MRQLVFKFLFRFLLRYDFQTPAQPDEFIQHAWENRQQLWEVNLNGAINVIDIIMIVGIILADISPDNYMTWAAD